MRKEKLVAAVVGGAMIITISVTGFVIWNAAKPKDKQQQAVKSVSRSTTVSTDSSLSVGDNTGVGGGIGGQAQSLDSAPVSESKTQQKQEDFSGYEKYKEDKSALIAEISKGDGAEVKSGSKVSIYYIGRLTTGQVFDNQWPAKAGDKPKPFEFDIGTEKIIVGLQQGMVGMKVGGKRRIIIPPAVGYGDKGQGSIPPSSVLIFDVELLKSE